MLVSEELPSSPFEPVETLGGRLEPGSRPTCGPSASGLSVVATDPFSVVLGTSSGLLEHAAASVETAARAARWRNHRRAIRDEVGEEFEFDISQ